MTLSKKSSSGRRIVASAARASSYCLRLTAGRAGSKFHDAPGQIQLGILSAIPASEPVIRSSGRFGTYLFRRLGGGCS